MFSTVSSGSFSGSGVVFADLAMGGNSNLFSFYFASDGVLSANTLAIDRVNKEGDRYRLFIHDFSLDNQQYLAEFARFIFVTGDTIEVGCAAGGDWTIEIMAGQS